jgi:type II secretory pathway predicted ATPase ExeA
MYVEYFKLNALPFSLNPDSRFVYRSREHARAQAYLRSASAKAGGCISVVGEPGVGKTLLLQTFVDACPREFLVAQVNYPLESISEFLRAVLSQLSGTAPTADSQDLFRAFSDFLAQSNTHGRNVLLVVDEAQSLSRHVLASVLQLGGQGAPYSGDLRVVIAGDLELDGSLAAGARERGVRQLCESIRLLALARSEIGPYIEHRLEVAGAEGRRIMQPDVFDDIYRYTAGSPRRVNMLCDTAMTIACARNSGSVSQAELRSAIEELHWTPEAMPSDRPESVRAGNGARESNTRGTSPASEGRVSATSAMLYVAHKGKLIAQMELTYGRASIGRAPGNDLQLVSELVSRHHCRVLTTKDGSIIEDASSTNGVYMNQRRVRRRRLRDGDVLTIGDHELRYAKPSLQDSSAT